MHTPTVTRFHLIREHRLHGIVTGMEAVKTVNSQEDNLDRLLISFKDAKVSYKFMGQRTVLLILFLPDCPHGMVRRNS